jgi:hypothetical protein
MLVASQLRVANMAEDPFEAMVELEKPAPTKSPNRGPGRTHRPAAWAVA